MFEMHPLMHRLQRNILLLDGAMGTEIQKKDLTEADYRGETFRDHAIFLKGNNDLLTLTQPDIIASIYNSYLEAGSDIIETNTFNANRISQADYKLTEYVYEMNLKAAQSARACCDAYTAANPEKPRFVCGSVGPTNRTASISPRVEAPGFRNVSFDDLRDAYYEQIRGLMDGGVDLIMIETIFDTLNARAALVAAEDLFKDRGAAVPIMISGTLTDKSGRTLSGQTLEAFVASMKSDYVISIGLNCSFGARELIPYVQRLAEISDRLVSVHPNAGLPNQLGAYDELPAETADLLASLIRTQSLNIVGGCCGTTPAHIAAIGKKLAGNVPRPFPELKHITVVAGLEPLAISREINFVNIGERTNVAGSAKFARLIREKQYEEALEVARSQVENGGQIIDINFDDGLLESAAEMDNFLKLIAAEPDISKVPIMIDSSDWAVIETGLRAIQGKPIVNSISLKNGEAEFMHHAHIIKKFGAAAVIMAFDENGQADTYERKIQIARRAYDILTQKVNFPPEDIIFDMNILAIGTGIEAHANYAVDFIRAVSWIKKNLPFAKTSGGLSNLSFSFRGNNIIREAMHSAFLYHAIREGFDMAILNPGMIQIYDEIDPVLLERVEDVIFNRYPEATDKLIEYASTLSEQKSQKSAASDAWRNDPFELRLKHALMRGITQYLEPDLNEALASLPKALDIIEGPLMDGMKAVGNLFGEGKMFLPQVVKTARVMKQAVDFLLPYIEAENASEALAGTSAGKVLLATVKGDVHDIGKNIVGIVLQCNNFEVLDLGIMVPPEEILETARRENVDIIGLSGLITPSLNEMVHVAAAMEEGGFDIPLLIGGATTSKLHTGLKIIPNYHGPVIYEPDAPKAVEAAKALMNASEKTSFVEKTYDGYKKVIEISEQNLKPLDSLEIAREKRPHLVFNADTVARPHFIGTKVIEDVSVQTLVPFIDWVFFFHAWELKGKFPEILSHPEYGEEAQKLYNDAQALLRTLEGKLNPRAVFGIYPAYSDGEDIIADRGDQTFPFYTMRQQRIDSEHLSLADFIASKDAEITDYIGAFAVTGGLEVEALCAPYEAEGDTYTSLMIKVVADRLAEAFAEWLHLEVRKNYWGYAPDENLSLEALLKADYRGIRPAMGYPSLVDHAEKTTLFDLLNATENTGITLTEHFMMVPTASVCGLFLAHPDSRYFDVFHLGQDQIDAYATRKGISPVALEQSLGGRIRYTREQK
jgi:5-methyltetrahydrofolate--homocysteine methyltransferase